MSETSQCRIICQIKLEVYKKKLYFALFDMVMLEVWPGDTINLLPDTNLQRKITSIVGSEAPITVFFAGLISNQRAEISINVSTPKAGIAIFCSVVKCT